MSRVLGNILCDLDPLTLESRSNMYFLGNVSPKPFAVATSDFAGA